MPGLLRECLRRARSHARFQRLTIVLLTCLALGSDSPAQSAPRLRAPSFEARDATKAAVTRLTMGLIENEGVSHRRLDADLAAKSVERYLDVLDPQHVLFLDSDVEELTADTGGFARGLRAEGDTRRARTIFDRYLVRLAQQSAYDEGLLRTTTFDFAGRDTYTFDRAHSPRPHDTTIARALWSQAIRAEYLQEKIDNPSATAKEIVAVLEQRLKRHLADMEVLSDEDVFDAYLDTLARVYDPYAEYLSREDLETYADTMTLSLVGVGAALTKVDGVCTIGEIAPGSPAARAGVEVGDRVVAAGEKRSALVDLSAVPLRKAVQLLRGAEGTSLVMRILPPVGSSGGARTLTIARAHVNLADRRARGWVIEGPTGLGRSARLARIELPSFYSGDAPDGREGAAADVKALLLELKEEHVEGLLLDLRRNGGGSLEEAIRVAGLFLGAGPIVQIRDSGGHIAVANHEIDRALFDGPLAVLTSRTSASASELVAAALQDRGRALIVGDSTTFGKGTIQTLTALAPMMDRMGLGYAFDPGAIKFTVARFYGPSGTSPDGNGIRSDVAIPSLTDMPSSRQPAPATPPLAALAFEMENRVRPLLARLRALSATRVRGAPAFSALRQQVDAIRAFRTAGGVSLNESERRAELTASVARQDALEREARALARSETIVRSVAVSGADSASATIRDRLARPTRSAAPGQPSLAGRSSFGIEAYADDEIVAHEALSILTDYIRLLSPGVGPGRAVGVAGPSKAPTGR